MPSSSSSSPASRSHTGAKRTRPVIPLPNNVNTHDNGRHTANISIGADNSHSLPIQEHFQGRKFDIGAALPAIRTGHRPMNPSPERSSSTQRHTAQYNDPSLPNHGIHDIEPTRQMDHVNI